MTFFEACKHADGSYGRHFEYGILLKCLPKHYHLIGKILLFIWPVYFRRDITLIGRLKNLKSFEEIEAEMNYFRYCNPENGIFRGVMRMRLSHRKLKGVARKVMLT
jgi:hypothetical protein